MPFSGAHFTKTTWYVLLMVYVSFIAMALAGVAYTNHVAAKERASAAENDHKWCRLLTVLDDAYNQAPPQTPTGKRVATEVHTLRVELHC